MPRLLRCNPFIIKFVCGVIYMFQSSRSFVTFNSRTAHLRGRWLILTALISCVVLVALVFPSDFANRAHAQQKRATNSTAQTTQANTAAARPTTKRITPLRASDAADGSRVTITSDVPLNDYAAYRSGNRFYVVIPGADASTIKSGVRGRGFEDAQVQKRGNDAVLSFRLNPGAKARVNQRFNRLDVVFDAPGDAGQSAAQTAANRNSNQANNAALNTAAATTRTAPSTQNTSPRIAAAQNNSRQSVQTSIETNSSASQNLAARRDSIASLPSSTEAPASAPVVTNQGQSATTENGSNAENQMATNTSPASPDSTASPEQIAQAQTPPQAAAGSAVTNVARPATTGTTLATTINNNLPWLLIGALILAGGLFFAARASRKSTSSEVTTFVSEKSSTRGIASPSETLETGEVISIERNAAATEAALFAVTPAAMSDTVPTAFVAPNEDAPVEATSVEATSVESVPVAASEISLVIVAPTVARVPDDKHSEKNARSGKFSKKNKRKNKLAATPNLATANEKEIASTPDVAQQTSRTFELVEPNYEQGEMAEVEAVTNETAKEEFPPSELAESEFTMSPVVEETVDTDDTAKDEIVAATPLVIAPLAANFAEAVSEKPVEQFSEKATPPAPAFSNASTLSAAPVTVLDLPLDSPIITRELHKLLNGEPHDDIILRRASKQSTREFIAAELLATLATRNIARRERAQNAFITYGFFDRAAQDLSDAETAPTVRVAAARALGLSSNKAATPHLIHALEDRMADVRRAAVEALASLRDPEALAALKSLREREPDRAVPHRLIDNAIESCTPEAMAVSPSIDVATSGMTGAAEIVAPTLIEKIETPEYLKAPKTDFVKTDSVRQTQASHRELVDAALKNAAEPNVHASDEQNAAATSEIVTSEIKEPSFVSESVVESIIVSDENTAPIESEVGWFDLQMDDAATQTATPTTEVSAASAPEITAEPEIAEAETVHSEIVKPEVVIIETVEVEPAIAEEVGESIVFVSVAEETSDHVSGVDTSAETSSTTIASAIEAHDEDIKLQTALSAADDTAASGLDYIADEAIQADEQTSEETAIEVMTQIPQSIRTRLISRETNERVTGVAALGRLSGDEALQAIYAAFDDRDAEVRNAAAQSLHRSSADHTGAFTRALRESTPQRRRNIGASIAGSGLAQHALANLTGESRERTYEAFSLLFLMAKAGEFAPLLKAVEQDPNTEVRLAVVKLLALSGQPEVLPAFRRLAVRGSLPADVRSAVMEAVYQISNQTPSPAQRV